MPSSRSAALRSCSRRSSTTSPIRCRRMRTATHMVRSPWTRRCLLAHLQPTCITQPHATSPHRHFLARASPGAHRKFLEFNVEQHRELWEYGKEIGIEWATSTWDVTSAREMITIPCDFLKARAARCTNRLGRGASWRGGAGRRRRRGPLPSSDDDAKLQHMPHPDCFLSPGEIHIFQPISN